MLSYLSVTIEGDSLSLSVSEIIGFFSYQSNEKSRFMLLRAITRPFKLRFYFYFAEISIKSILLSMHVLPRMIVMFDFLCTGSVELHEARGKWSVPRLLINRKVVFESKRNKNFSF